MSCAVFETESIVAVMTAPAQELSALAAPRETRVPATTPTAMAVAGDTDRNRRIPVARPPAITGAKHAIRLKCLSFRPFAIVADSYRTIASWPLPFALCPLPFALEV